MKRTILVIAISFTSGFLSHKLVVEKTSTTHKKATALTQSSELTPSVKNLSTHDIEIKLQKEIDEIKDKNNTLRIKLSEALSELSKKEKNAIRQREDLGNEILQAKEKGRIPTPHNLLDIAENFDSESLQNHFKNESVDHNWAYSQQEALTHFFQETPLLSDNVIYENTCKKTLCRLSISTSDINEFHHNYLKITIKKAI